MTKETEVGQRVPDLTEEERLLTFLEKSKQMKPHCFGAYDKEDSVCTRYCAWGNVTHESTQDSKVREALNESTHPNTFFTVNNRTSFCGYERKKLEEAVKKAQDALKRTIDNISYRNYAIAHMRRIPVGEVRHGRVVHDFTKTGILKVDHAGNYIYSESPFSGPLYRVSETRLGDIVSISIPSEELYGRDIAVYEQAVDSDELVLTVRKAKFNSRDGEGEPFEIRLNLESTYQRCYLDNKGVLER